jgi:hypothetical protein
MLNVDYYLTTTTRMLCGFSFLFRFLFPHENSKTIGTNNLTKESKANHSGGGSQMTPSCKRSGLFVLKISINCQ